MIVSRALEHHAPLTTSEEVWWQCRHKRKDTAKSTLNVVFQEAEAGQEGSGARALEACGSSVKKPDDEVIVGDGGRRSLFLSDRSEHCAPSLFGATTFVSVQAQVPAVSEKTIPISDYSRWSGRRRQWSCLENGGTARKSFDPLQQRAALRESGTPYADFRKTTLSDITRRSRAFCAGPCLAALNYVHPDPSALIHPSSWLRYRWPLPGLH